MAVVAAVATVAVLGADIFLANGSLRRLAGSNVLGDSHDIEVDLSDHNTLFELKGLGDGAQGKGRSHEDGSARTHFEGNPLAWWVDVGLDGG